MSTFGGPYRENEPKPEYKEPFWWKVKRAARAIFGFFGARVAPSVTMALLIGGAPAVVAHAYGAYTWHWVAVFAVIAAAMVTLWWRTEPGTGGRLALIIVGAVTYFVALLVLGAAGEPSPKECRDELHAVRPIGKTECSKPNHISKQVERGKDLYLECKCPR